MTAFGLVLHGGELESGVGHYENIVHEIRLVSKLTVKLFDSNCAFLNGKRSDWSAYSPA
jgi:hypothetical protein